MLDIEALNKYGETAHELTCSNDSKCSSDAKKKRIRDLLSGMYAQCASLLHVNNISALAFTSNYFAISAPIIYYVPVLRAPDNSVYPKLSTPCTYPELIAQESETCQSLRMEATVLSSIAGPMSPLQAKAFYNEWRSPSQSIDRKEAKNVKRTDPDRGLERIGRYVVVLVVVVVKFVLIHHL